MVVLVSSTPQYERPEEGGADGATRRTSCVPNHRTLCAPRFPSYNRRTVPERPRVASVLTAGRRGSRSGPPQEGQSRSAIERKQSIARERLDGRSGHGCGQLRGRGADPTARPGGGRRAGSVRAGSPAGLRRDREEPRPGNRSDPQRRRGLARGWRPRADRRRDRRAPLPPGSPPGSAGGAVSAEPVPEVPLLVFFHSKRSGQSRRVEGYLSQVLQRRGNHNSFQVYRVEVEEQPQLVQRFRVDAVPTLVVVSGNRVRDRAITPRGCREIEQLLQPWLH
ncbi:MAG: thioredoxin family protein [Actinobacteria bacterium]|nr:MAG: thioredoxin family protein [Actinomycetota bacterium]